MERKWTIDLWKDIVKHGNMLFHCDFPLPDVPSMGDSYVIGLVKYYNDFGSTGKFIVHFKYAGEEFSQVLGFRNGWGIAICGTGENTEKYDNFTGYD